MTDNKNFCDVKGLVFAERVSEIIMLVVDKCDKLFQQDGYLSSEDHSFEICQMFTSKEEAFVAGSVFRAHISLHYKRKT